MSFESNAESANPETLIALIEGWNDTFFANTLHVEEMSRILPRITTRKEEIRKVKYFNSAEQILSMYNMLQRYIKDINLLAGLAYKYIYVIKLAWGP